MTLPTSTYVIALSWRGAYFDTIRIEARTRGVAVKRVLALYPGTVVTSARRI